jgi:hypothetical protein
MKSSTQQNVLSPLEIWHSRIDLDEEVERIKDLQLRRHLSALIAKARDVGLEEDYNFPHLVTGAEPRIANRLHEAEQVPATGGDCPRR